MSVKRYKVEELNCCFDADMVESSTGEYVEYFDYAKLKAEIERLKTHSFTDEELASMKAQTELLHAQFKRDLFNQVVEDNKRLCKAGDELLDGWIGMYGDHKGSMAENYIKLWNAAKEGKPSV